MVFSLFLLSSVVPHRVDIHGKKERMEGQGGYLADGMGLLSSGTSRPA
jgi:hypothetical protein